MKISNRRVQNRPLVAGRQKISTKWRPAAILMAVFLAGVAASGLSASVRAAEWVVEGRAALRSEFDDNITLDPDDELSDFSATFSPEMDIGGRSDNWDLFLNTRLDFARFTEEDFLDSEDIRVALESSYRTQLGVWELDAIFRRATTRTTELTDTGRLDVGAERIDFEILPSWSYILTPRDSIFLGAGWQRADFDALRAQRSEQRVYVALVETGHHAHARSETRKCGARVAGHASCLHALAARRRTNPIPADGSEYERANRFPPRHAREVSHHRGSWARP